MLLASSSSGFEEVLPPASAATLRRSFSSTSLLRQDGSSDKAQSQAQQSTNDASNNQTQEEGAMSRRLAEMTEEALLEGGRSARKSIQEAGFSEELKQQLEERVKASAFKSENAAAFSVANMPVSRNPKKNSIL